MTDPRKPVLPTDRSDSPESMSAYDLTYSILRQATEIGARSLRCTGASFVTSAMGIWALELRDIDRRAGAEFLRALADMVEIDDAPGSDAPATATGSHEFISANIEIRRATAVRDLMAAVDLMMAKPEGRG